MRETATVNIFFDTTFTVSKKTNKKTMRCNHFLHTWPAVSNATAERWEASLMSHIKPNQCCQSGRWKIANKENRWRGNWSPTVPWMHRGAVRSKGSGLFLPLRIWPSSPGCIYQLHELCTAVHVKEIIIAANHSFGVTWDAFKCPSWRQSSIYIAWWTVAAGS